MSDKYVSQRNLVFSMRQDGKKTGGGNIAFYLEGSALCKLAELIKYGDINISKTADGFFIKVGDFPAISIVVDFHKTQIMMGNISTMAPGAAELLAKIADLFFYDRKQRFKMQGYDAPSEKQMWEAATKLQIEVEAANNEQRQQFSEWAKQYGQQQMHKSKALFQSNQPDADANDAPDKKI
ncbi:MAG: hypothetical protein K0S29_660 [Gammaproteobacteria bacterium]|jgi:hypothetical protein|nr:hypothetical protein [Gammaproteobacteria bacterium]